MIMLMNSDPDPRPGLSEGVFSGEMAGCTAAVARIIRLGRDSPWQIRPSRILRGHARRVIYPAKTGTLPTRARHTRVPARHVPAPLITRTYAPTRGLVQRIVDDLDPAVR